MTSPSNQSSSDNALDNKEEQIAQRVNAALDHSLNNLSKEAVSDIAQARNKALNALYNKQAKPGLSQQLSQLFMQPFPRVALPVAAAVLIAVTLNYNSTDPVPALPLAMVSEEIPTEDLALLEDLEFVTWLAQNEQDVLL